MAPSSPSASAAFCDPPPADPLWRSLLGSRLIQHQFYDLCDRLRSLGGRSGGGLSRVGFGGVDCVVGCDGVGGVVGSGTCCAGFLLDILHLACEAAWLFETGSVRKKKNVIGLIVIVSAGKPKR